MPTPVYDEAALLNAIKDLLAPAALTWPDGGAVFGPNSVVVSPAPPTHLLAKRRTPLAQISTRGDVADEDDPGLREVTVAITIYAIDRRDEAGEAATIGATDGKGLLQIQRLVDLAIQKALRTTVPIRNVRRSAGQLQFDDVGTVVYRDLQFAASVAAQAE